jgi:hypothetical protein
VKLANCKHVGPHVQFAPFTFYSESSWYCDFFHYKEENRNELACNKHNKHLLIIIPLKEESFFTSFENCDSGVNIWLF